MPKYTLHSEDARSFKISHPDGTHFLVAKEGLDDRTIGKIRSMNPVKPFKDGLDQVPHLADGGFVPDDSQSQIPAPDSLDRIMTDTKADQIPVTSPTTTDDQNPYFTNGTFDFKKYALQNPDAPVSAKADALKTQNDETSNNIAFKHADVLKQISDANSYNEQAAKAGIPLMQVPADPTKRARSIGSTDNPTTFTPTQQQQSQSNPYSDIYGQMTDIQKQQAGAIQGMTEAQKSAGEQQAKSWNDYQVMAKSQNDAYQARIKSIDTEQEALAKNISNGKVEPNRVWTNMSTGNKVIASIGMLLSGIGSGLTGQPNMAMQVLDKTIERDIDAQKASLNQKHTLYSMNLQKYKNAEMADLATRNQMNTVVQTQIQMSMARTNSAQAISQGQMALAGLQSNQLQMKIQLAQMGMQAQSLGQGGGQMAGYPVGHEPMALLGEEKYQAKRVPVQGIAYQAATPDDAKVVKNLQAGYEPVRNALARLDALGPKAAIPGTDEHASAQSIISFLTPTLNKMHGLTRLSEEDIHLMNNQIGDPTSLKQLLTSGVKNSQFMRNLNDDLESEYKTRLIGYKGMSSIPSRKAGW